MTVISKVWFITDSDALQRTRAKHASFAADLERWEAVSRGTDFDG